MATVRAPRFEATRAWTWPIHYSDGIEMTCPARRGVQCIDTSAPTCADHGAVRPMLVPLAGLEGLAPQPGVCRWCGDAVAAWGVVCEACRDHADRDWPAILARPWAWTTPHPREPLLMAIGDYR